MRFVPVLALVACTAAETPPLPDDARPTDLGAVRGSVEGTSLVFRGIPFAAPPVDDLRWRAPAPAAAWTGIRDALAFGLPCVQVDEAGVVIGSEDCLTLNVWAPAALPAAPLPVLVFVHGGNNQIGCSCDGGNMPYYDGRYVAEHGPAIVVTLNYRLGPFGFLADPALADEHGATGNYALADQLAALEWVQRNIAAFGGDPRRVMLFGHSAGSVNVTALVASPRAAGLFSSAILHSGPSVVVDTGTVTRTWQAAEQTLGCTAAADRAACLRAQPASAVARVPGAVLGAPNDAQAQFYPTIDGQILAASPLATIRAGRHNHVPVLIGTTADEYSQLIDEIASGPVSDEAQYHAELQRLFGASLAAEVEAQYPAATYPSPRDALVAVVNDVMEICPTRQLSGAFAGDPDVRRFIYTHSFPGPLARYHAAHGFDILLLFHDLALVGATSANDAALADAMMQYWVAFAATGDPNAAAGLPAWPSYAPQQDNYLALDWPLATAAGARTPQCDFWDSQLL